MPSNKRWDYRNVPLADLKLQLQQIENSIETAQYELSMGCGGNMRRYSSVRRSLLTMSTTAWKLRREILERSKQLNVFATM